MGYYPNTARKFKGDIQKRLERLEKLFLTSLQSVLEKKRECFARETFYERRRLSFILATVINS